eukprot:46838_1
MAHSVNITNNNQMKHETKQSNTMANHTDTEDTTDTIVITKVILDFDDALFPSHLYKQHEILKYHESTSTESVETGRECFKEKEPSFMQLKKKIDLICFKLMQRYSKDNFVILSTGDYQWVESTLGYYEYLLSAYNIQIYSTQQWAKTHPNTDVNTHGSLSAKTFLMQMLLQKWRNEEQHKYNGSKKIKLRLISIGDSLFEFLGCYKIGYDYVNRIKLLEEPTVEQMSVQWDRILYLCRDSVYNASIVFVDQNEYFELDECRMNKLNEECLVRVHHTGIHTVFKCSLLDVITLDNTDCFEIVTDENGEQYQRRKQSTVNVQHDEVQTDAVENNYNSFVPFPVNHHAFYCQQQQILYAQQWLQQQHEMQSQFLFDVPQYTNLNYSDGYGPIHDIKYILYSAINSE